MNDQTTEDHNEPLRRFSEAVKMFTELRETIESLRDIETQQKEAQTALSNSAAAVTPAIEAVSKVSALGAELLVALQDAVTAATTALDQQTIKAISDGIAAGRREIAALRNEMHTEHATVAQELAELKIKIRSMPNRVQRKYGVDI